MQSKPKVTLRQVMLDFAKFVYEALDIQSPRVYIAVSGLLGALAFSGLAWLVVKGHQVKTLTETKQVATVATPTDKPKEVSTLERSRREHVQGILSGVSNEARDLARTIIRDGERRYDQMITPPAPPEVQELMAACYGQKKELLLIKHDDRQNPILYPNPQYRDALEWFLFSGADSASPARKAL